MNPTAASPVGASTARARPACKGPAALHDACAHLDTAQGSIESFRGAQPSLTTRLRRACTSGSTLHLPEPQGHDAIVWHRTASTQVETWPGGRWRQVVTRAAMTLWPGAPSPRRRRHPRQACGIGLPKPRCGRRQLAATVVWRRAFAIVLARRGRRRPRHTALRGALFGVHRHQHPMCQRFAHSPAGRADSVNRRARPGIDPWGCGARRCHALAQMPCG